MRYLVVNFVLLIIIQASCFGQVKQEGLFNIPKPKKQDFTIALALEQINDTEYLLIADLKLAEDAYIISHYSRDSFYLNFTLQYPGQESLISTSEIEEFPLAIEEFDPIIEREVKFIKTDTKFSQKFKLKTQDDITINGLIEFLVEPSCIPYDVLFSIKQEQGKMHLGDFYTKISKEYKL